MIFFIYHCRLSYIYFLLKNEIDDVDDLQLGKKKKKKKTVIDVDNNAALGAEENLTEATSWLGVDRDYTYDEVACIASCATT